MRPNTLSTRSSAPAQSLTGQKATQAPNAARTIRFTWTRGNTCPPPAPKNLVFSSDAAFIYALRAAQLTQMVRDGGYRPPAVRLRLPATQQTFTKSARTAPHKPLSDDAKAVLAIRASNYLLAALAVLGSPQPRFVSDQKATQKGVQQHIEQSSQSLLHRASQTTQRHTISSDRKDHARKPTVIYRHPATRDDIGAVGRGDAPNTTRESIATGGTKQDEPVTEVVPSYVVPINADRTIPEHVRQYVALSPEHAVPLRTATDADRELEELQNRQREAQERAALDLQAYAQALQAQDNSPPATPQQPAVDLQAYAQALQAQDDEKAAT